MQTPYAWALRLATTAALILGVLVCGGLSRGAANVMLRGVARDRVRFWTAQALHLLTLLGVVVVIVLEWANAGSGLATFGGWIAAGVTISLQRVVTAFAGYLIILRGNIFTVGDRITIGGVRGDVVALGFMQTTVMEMGQTPGEKEDNPSMWIHGRQYSGRLVRVTNDKIFDTPIYNYTRHFPFIWEEIRIPIRYADDYAAAERVLLDVARRHTAPIAKEAEKARVELERKFYLHDQVHTQPRVFVRLTDNWVELSLRFLARDRDIRSLKDAMSREILDGLRAANIGIASGTYAIVELPPVTVRGTVSAPRAD